MTGPCHSVAKLRKGVVRRNMAIGMRMLIESFWSLFDQSGAKTVISRILAVRLRSCIARLRKSGLFEICQTCSM